MASNGARHTVQDFDNNGSPNTQGGIAAVWLGSSVDFSPSGESDGIPTANAQGDDNANTDDENGVTLLGVNQPDGGTTFSLWARVTVNTSEGACANCKLGAWIDWNNDGDFADADEYFLKSVATGSQDLEFKLTDLAQLAGTNVYARFRLYAGNYSGSYLPTGLIMNGEVEDYLFTWEPTAIALATFTAAEQDGAIMVAWDTFSELDNAGFNLYRATSTGELGVKLNAALIPSQGPNSQEGFSYSYTDAADLTPGATYYYRLQDVSSGGATTLHDPVDVTYGGAPNAVGLAVFGADAAPAALSFAALALTALAAVAARRRKG